MALSSNNSVGLPLDEYAQRNIFDPLKMAHTRYLPMNAGCGNVGWTSQPGEAASQAIIVCLPNGWRRELWIPHTAPTAHDNEGTPTTNPDFDYLLRGTVHDPTTRRMGGVAGHAGVFSLPPTSAATLRPCSTSSPATPDPSPSNKPPSAS